MDLAIIQNYMTQYPETTWMILGMVLFLAEIFLTPGFGFLFASFAAITLGAVIMVLGESPSIYMQITYFFGLTLFWTIILWKPLKKWTMSKNGGYEEYVGTGATIVDKSLKKGKAGKVKWSGAIMKARLVENSSVEEMKSGDEVWVHAMEKGTLIVDVNKPEGESS